MPKLSGKIALITGGSKGIGAAIARELAHAGAHVIVNYLSSETAANSLVAELQENGYAAEAQRCDISDPDECRNLFRQVLEQERIVDILVNNAGITRDRSLRNMSELEWDVVLKVNLTGAKTCARLALEHMIPASSGTIINVASVIGQAGAFGQSNYAASKGALIAFTKALALEVARFGITVNAVCPGYIATDMWQSIPENVREKLVLQIPLGRPGTAEEVASFVRYLAEEGSYLTGQAFNINGGLYRGS